MRSLEGRGSEEQRGSVGRLTASVGLMLRRALRLDWCYDEARDATPATGSWHMLWGTI